MTDDGTIYEVTTIYSASIIKRGRGIYLVHLEEDENGTDDHAAFPTLAEAKKYARDWFDGPGRLRWEVVREGRHWRATYERIQQRQLGDDPYTQNILSEHWREYR